MEIPNDFFFLAKDKSEIPDLISDEELSVLEKINDTSSVPMGSSMLVDKILSEKRDILRNTIADIISSIHERQRLMTEAIAGIEKRECAIISLIMNIDPFVCYSMRVDDKRIVLEKEYSFLKKQKAEHIVQCWRDINMLKKELRELREEYLIMKYWSLAT